MKCIIAGGRGFVGTQKDRELVYGLLRLYNVTEVVSGGCSGADAFGEEVARSMEIPVKRFPADWKKLGRSAGPVRNEQMAKYADAVILLPGGAGTDNMRLNAHRYGLRILFDARV